MAGKEGKVPARRRSAPARMLRAMVEGDGTHRFTVGWVLSLAAIAALAITSLFLVRGTAQAQSQATALADELDVLVTSALEVSARAQTLSPASSTEDVAALEQALDELDARHALLAARTTSITAAAQEHAAVLAAGQALVDAAAGDTRAQPTTGSNAALADDLLQASAAYTAAVDEVGDQLLRETAARVEETERLQTRMMLAIVALLLVESLLVFAPATRRIRAALERRRQEAEHERLRSQRQLEMLARYDHLTGLANRVMFRDRLGHAVASAERSGKRVALMFLDLDKFKDVNDELGHDAGDDLLIEIAERLQEIARRTDTIARIGGDEFTMILEGLDAPDGAATVAQKTLESLARPIDLDGRQVTVTGSIGIALYPDDAEAPEELLRHADAAMYQAKASGKNTFQFSTPELREANLIRLHMIEELRAAVAQQRLRLAFQPQLDLHTDRIVAVEALVRWIRDDDTEVTAGDFIEIAEDTDVMQPLGEWVLRTACEQAVAWQRDGLGPVRIAVNLSARQFRQVNLPTLVATTLAETGLDPHLLAIEVTEASLVQDVEVSSATLRLLKGIGVRIAIDDFGTGYSSLASLRRFPIDELKIDHSFVQDVTDQTDDQPVPAAVVGLAHNLGMETTGEGVETAGQLEFLRRIGCDRAQGFRVSAPVSAEEVAALVRRSQLRTVQPAEHDDAG